MPSNGPNNNAWEYQQTLVLDKLEQHAKDLEAIKQLQIEIRIELATLKVKVITYGGITSLIVASLITFAFKAMSVGG